MSGGLCMASVPCLFAHPGTELEVVLGGIPRPATVLPGTPSPPPRFPDVGLAFTPPPPFWTMSERKTLFFLDVFPNLLYTMCSALYNVQYKGSSVQLKVYS